MIRVAVIGLGGRVSGMLGLMRKLDPELRVVAVADPTADKARAKIKEHELHPDIDAPRIYPDADKLLENAEKYDAFVIGTRCNLHTPMAVKIASLKLPLFLEKPVAINWEQIRQLGQAYRDRLEQVVVSFPLRVSPLFTTALEIVRSGRLGKINQIQAVNNVPYGGVYFGSWYRNYNEVGGLWLQKATHDFDYLNRVMDPSRAHTVAASVTRMIYGGDMPHDLRCSQCDKINTCNESPVAHRVRDDDGGMSYPFKKFEDHYCVYSREIRNEDSGSAILKYESGAQVAYSQNFISRRTAGARGATIIGYDATLKFDWYTDQLTVTDHHGHFGRVDQVTVKPTSGHGGGDAILGRMFIDLIRQQRTPDANLRDGLISAAMCLSARDSSDNDVFVRIPTVGQITA